jgi:CDP-diacylglycerol--glycerol-3-phosphate 3-phosphatidyltransferase
VSRNHGSSTSGRATTARQSARDAQLRARATYVRGQAKVVERARGRVVQAGDTKVSDGNLANLITIVRILLAPLFFWLLLADDGRGGTLRWIATALFVLAIATDGVDGHLARRRNLVTNVGILLDPIADKVLIGGALVALSVLAELPWWVSVLILVREVGITVFRFIALRDRVIPASRGGKLKTIIQSVAISVLLAPLPALADAVGLDAAVPWIVGFGVALMSLAVVLTVVTGADYLWQAWQRNRRA